jgi:hypothetical protein
VAHFPKGAPLVRFFGLFYAGTAVLALLIQATLGRTVLARLGLGGSVASHPATVGSAALLAFAIPGPWRGVLPRGLDASVRNSVFRAGYELLYTPLPEATKRKAKAVIDVAWDSAGKALGAGAVLLVTLLPAAAAFAAVNALVVLAAAAEFAVAPRLRPGYVRELEGGLRRGSDVLEDAAAVSLSDFTAVESFAGLDRASVLRAVGVSPDGPPSPPADLVVGAIVELRSGAGDRSRVWAALRTLPKDPLVAGALIPLLARRDLLRETIAAFETDDAHLRGTALEYFETVLPPDLFAALARRLPAGRLSSGRPAAGPRRAASEVRDELVKAGATMTMSLDEVRRHLAAAAEDE